VLTSASYQASEAGFQRLGLEPAETAELLGRSVRLAQAARGERADVLVAASVGPYGAVLAGGQEYTGEYGEVDGHTLERFHEPRLRALLAAGPDCVACETIPRVSEAAALVRVLATARAWVAAGARLVGGCCGLGPAAVRELALAHRGDPS